VPDQSARVFEEALLLPHEERAKLAERLLSSLDSPRRQRVDRLWAREAEERLAAFERGEIKTVSAREALEEA
jgi:hypothetical protein